ncbi:hypothetical protein WME98_51300 [Sorangium sp. So ce296]|uniref:hypothetical protein n=1 Tax=Sorangium sp. So ce296 TaxID=3133296 RepID=UPI003F602D17
MGWTPRAPRGARCAELTPEGADMHRFVVELNGEGAPGQTKWRVVPPSGETPDWVTGQGKQELVARAEDGAGRNTFDVRYVFRMID